jgi:hypothetical protein
MFCVLSILTNPMTNPLKDQSVRIEWHEIDAFNQDVQSFPAKPASQPTTASARQTIEGLYDTLVFLRRERNYKYEDLAYHLEERLGLKLSPSTVKSYMDLAARKRRQASDKKGSPPVPRTNARAPSVPPIESPPPVRLAMPPGTGIVNPIPIAPPAEIEVPITPAIVDATTPEPQSKVPLRPGEWSHTELRKHFNKY